MIFDKLSLFADGLTVPTTANGTTLSKCVDLRYNGQVGIDGMLRIWGGVIGTANATGSVTTVLQTSDDGASWTDVVSETQNGGTLIGMFLPLKGLKRFIRLSFRVGGTALGSAIVVKAGLVDQFDQEAAPKVADPFAATDPVDVAEKLYAVQNGGMKLSATSGTTTAGTGGTVDTIYVTNTLGTITAAVTLSGSTSTHVTATQDGTDLSKWVIAATSSVTAADYLVTFADGFGNKAVYTVTGTAA